MAFPSGPTSTPLVLPTQTIGGVTYTFSRINFSLEVGGGGFTAKCWVGVKNSRGFRLKKADADGVDLITCTVNLVNLIATFT
jgi:hypothetical protein